MLSDGQVLHFNTFGFLKLPQLFSREEMEIMRGEMHEIIAEQAPSNGGAERVSVMPFTERRPFLAWLVDDDRIYDIPHSILGPAFLFEI